MRIRKSLYLLLALFLSAYFLSSAAFSQNPAAYHAEVYFSPGGCIESRIIKAIDNARVSIDLAIYSFTSKEIKSSLELAHRRGVEIRIIADSKQAEGKYSVIRPLYDAGFRVKIIHGKGSGIMHNKFALFDRNLLLTGSYNWTKNAESFNYENAIFLSDPEIIKQYQSEFDDIWYAH
ncbi:MAG: phospholipase [Candidatus Omnitrophica bacterium CG11_big_fil_rev_8_21_14_0_20_42_13]|uniref:phospholipase D n=1 Tax=Candidatus Ghiorseimicrobium undicola TaxID=1974746 RepID=A0A2H0LWE9_9BACT|nr:MAG: phospholipase [Candidatus Omnitrophica bacterium CG11_big_fil_rev_8_21_14_0_20_42_13]